MILRALFALSLVMAPLAAAPVPKELKRTDEQRILGKWEMVVYYRNGTDAGPQTVHWLLEEGGRASIINPKAIGPKDAITFKLTAGNGFDWQWPNSLHAGIYRLDGDTLKIAMGEGNVRPGEVKPGGAFSYCEFKRVIAEGK